MKICLILLAVLGLAVAEVAHFQYCDESSDEICEVTGIDIAPCPGGSSSCRIRRGRRTDIQFSYIPKFSAQNLETGLFWASPGGDLPFDQLKNADACPYTACPTQPGTSSSFSYGLDLNKKLPVGKYTLKWKLWNGDEPTQSCCFLTKIDLKK